MEIPTKQKRLLQKSIALTLTCGALLAGSAGMAYASATTTTADDWATSTVTIDVAKDWEIASMFPENPAGQNVAAKSIVLSGGKLTLKDGGRLIGLTQDMDFNMTDGSLTLTSGNTANQITSIDVAKVSIAGGTVNLTGQTGNDWENAAYIGGYDGLTVSNGTINMNANSDVFVGKYTEAGKRTEMKLSGGTINLLGSATNGGYGNDAAHIWASSSGYPSTVALTMDGAVLVVGNGSDEKYGVISADNATLSAGSITVKDKGHLLLQPNAGTKANAKKGTASDLVYKGDLNGTLQIKDKGEFTVNQGGHVDLGQHFKIAQTGGKVTVDGTMFPMGWDDVATGEYAITGGELLVGATKGVKYAPLDGSLHAGVLTIGGGKIIVGNDETGLAWAKTTALGGYGNVTTVSGGTIALNNSGALWAGAQGTSWDTAAASALNISGGEITMNGADETSASVIAATSKGAWEDDNTKADHVVLNISDTAKIQVANGKHGYIASRETNMAGGAISVGEGANLKIAGLIAQVDTDGKALTAKEGFEQAKTDSQQGGEFTLNGGAINIAKNGKLDFADGDVDFTLEGGSFAADATSVVNFANLTYDGGTWGLSKTIALQDTAGVAAGVYAKSFTVTGQGLAFDKITQSVATGVGLEVDGGSLQLGALEQSSGGVLVDSKGSLTVGKLAQTGGVIAIGGADGAGTLKVTESLKNIAYVGTLGSEAGIELGNLGTLEADKNILLKDSATLADNVNTLGVLAGSTVKLTGMGEATIATADLTKIKTALAGNSADFKGVLDLGNANIQTTPDADGNVDYTDVAGVTNDSLKDSTIKVDATTAGNGISGGFKDVKVDGTTASVTANNTLQLVGSSADNALLKDEDGKTLALTVNDGAVVTLGDTAANNKGVVGDVTLGSGSGNAALNTVGKDGGVFTAGDITKHASANATVTVEGATLNAKNVGAAGTEIDAIHLNKGAALQVSGDVYVETVSGNGGTLVGKSVTVKTDADISNGTIQATAGNVTLAGGVSGMSGSIVSDKGDIAAAGQDIKAAEGESLQLSAAGGVIAAKDIAATNVTAKTLTASGAVAISDGTLVLGDADSTVGNALSLVGTDAAIGQKLTVAGAATIDGGTLQTAADGELVFNGGATLQGGAVVNVDKLTGASGQTIQVGSDAEKAGGATLLVKTLDLKSGKLIVDPEWGVAASKAAFETTAATSTPEDIKLDGHIGVGRNSMLTIGVKDTEWLELQVKEATGGTGLDEHGVTAAMGLKKHITLGTGMGLVLDGSKTSADFSSFTGDTLSFAANSLLVVDAAAFDAAKGAISAESSATINVDAGAKLRITDARVGQDYEVFNAAGNITAGTLTGWTNADISTNSDLITLSGDGSGKFTTAVASDLDARYSNLSAPLRDTLRTMVANGENGVDATAGGAKFLSRATAVGSHLNGDRELATTTIEGAARMAALGGVPQMTLTALDASRSAIDARTSFASADQGRLTLLNDNSEASGGALWLMPIYQKVKSDDLDAGRYGYDVDGHLTGAAFGYDYTTSANTRTGLTFSFGSGSADSSGLSYTDNDLDYWGLGAYTSWQHDNFNLVADLSYAKTKSDLTQSLSSAMDMGQLKADDISGKALSFGLRGEYRYQNGDAEIIPHFGLRYTKLDTDSYTAYATNGGHVLSASDSSQKIWTFPIGVTFTKTIQQKSGWTCKPVFDLSLIPASGNLDADSVVRFTGVNSNALVSTEVMGDFSYKGTLGVEFGKDNLTYGLGYSIQASSEMTNHTVYGMVRYAF